MSERKIHKIDAKKVKTGDIVAFTYFTKVKSVSSSGATITVEDLLNNLSDITINGTQLIENSSSADQYAEEEKVSKTQAATFLTESHNRPLTVCFDKEDGTERVLRGRLIKHESLLGRSMVEDLDIKDKHKVRLVDHRTLKWLIVDGVKYIVK